MKANEFQIGDIVLLDNEPIKIEQITKRKVGYHIKPNECRMNYVRLVEIEPIEITPEILEKNGFRGGLFYILLIGNGIWLEYYSLEHKLREWRNGGHSIAADLIFQCHVRYVHELQHALRLCGIDKEIVL